MHGEMVKKNDLVWFSLSYRSYTRELTLRHSHA